MEKEYEVKGNQLIYHMPKEIDHHVAKHLREKMEQLIAVYQIRKLVLDFSKTELMDSSGIGTVIGRCKTMGYYGGGVSVCGLNERISNLFLTSGLMQLVQNKEEEEV